jgi:hypothetical protein
MILTLWISFMAKESSPLLTEFERAEWDAVLFALSRTPRLAKLLRYIGELYFQNRPTEITEFHIATEVFGRSQTVFDSSKDSIARVEAHRLRKRLKEFYESEGKDHAISISLPTGNYVPSFIHHDTAALARNAIALKVGLTEEQDAAGPHPIPQAEHMPGHPFRRRALRVALAATASILVLAAVGFAYQYWIQKNHSSGSAGRYPQVPAGAVIPANLAPMPLRLLAGYDGTPRIDSAGNYWLADRYYSAGVGRTRPGQAASHTSDPMLFDHWRLGDFHYDIPLAPGTYELHLFFVTPQPEDVDQGIFSITANGNPLLQWFNISSDALGADVADERIFFDISPDKDGYLHLAFAANSTEPSLNAIEILPGLPHKMLPIRLVMQRTSVTDRSGNFWHPDNYFQNGRISDVPEQVSGTSDPDIYANERFGHFAYSIPVDTRSRYSLVLHFAELYWANDGAGRRRFRVLCNGSTLLDDFDIFKEAGSLHALTKTFHHLHPSPEGKLNLTFEPLQNNATVSAIEVLDEGQ